MLRIRTTSKPRQKTPMKVRLHVFTHNAEYLDRRGRWISVGSLAHARDKAYELGHTGIQIEPL